jgi:1,4-alpha-glucan branching enzyme
MKLSRTNTGTVKVTFALPLSEAPVAVSVLGDFNAWDVAAHPMRKRSNGTRSATVELDAGRAYHFKYLDEAGTWFNEPDAHGHETNEYGETNSVVRT